MNTTSTNIYKFARLSSQLTQEQASDMMGVSRRTLIAYEVYERVPSDEMVHRMIKIYNTKYLAYLHLKQNSDLGRYLPDLHFGELSQCVLRLQKEVRDVTKMNDKIVDIAMDGYVSDFEERDWNKILIKLDEVAAAAMSLIFLNNSRELI
jgi:DNA-binding XRE family transcriptional regulator